MGDVIKLPTAATSFYTIRRAGKYWAVVLVTPCTHKALRTVLSRWADRESAFAHATVSAQQTHTPFKVGAK